jgi:Transposase DDE domain group 1
VDELIGRVRRAGAAGELIFRADSGFWSAKVIARLRAHDSRFSITVRQTRPVRAAIAAIPEAAWVDIAYPDSGVAQVAETPFLGDRLIVRRVRHHTDQGQLFATWDYHALVTDRPGTMTELDADHRRHAVVELAIRDAKSGAGLNHHPSSRFFANAAWLVLVCLAHNLLRWTATLGLGTRNQLVVAKTLRRTPAADQPQPEPRTTSGQSRPAAACPYPALHGSGDIAGTPTPPVLHAPAPRHRTATPPRRIKSPSRSSTSQHQSAIVDPG